MSYTPQQIIKMNAYETSEITCRRMFSVFKKQYSNNKIDLKIQSTLPQTIYDANLRYTDTNNKVRKCQVEFKVRYKLYDEMFIEPKNVKHANLCNYEYLYINFYDDLSTQKRHMYIWSSYDIDFNNLDTISKEIGISEVEDKGTKTSLRYLLPISIASEHYVTDITELWPELQTQEYIDMLFSK